MPVEAIVFLYFFLVLAPVVIVLAYCGIRNLLRPQKEPSVDADGRADKKNQTSSP